MLCGLQSTVLAMVVVLPQSVLRTVMVVTASKVMVLQAVHDVVLGLMGTSVTSSRTVLMVCTVVITIVGVGDMSLFGIGVVRPEGFAMASAVAEAACSDGRGGRVEYG
jgi:hypothetical protein